MAALLAGQGVTEVARAYNLPKGTVGGWKAEIETEQIRTKKGERLEGMVFDYLTANFEALRQQAEVASDQNYLRKQSADNLAVLHGVMADKAVRLLEAAAAAAASAGTEGDQEPVDPASGASD